MYDTRLQDNISRRSLTRLLRTREYTLYTAHETYPNTEICNTIPNNLIKIKKIVNVKYSHLIYYLYLTSRYIKLWYVVIKYIL